MKYSIIKVVNGNFSVAVETADLNNAKVNFHDLCKSLWSAADVVTACVIIADENLNIVEGYREFISHVEPEAE